MDYSKDNNTTVFGEFMKRNNLATKNDLGAPFAFWTTGTIALHRVC